MTMLDDEEDKSGVLTDSLDSRLGNHLLPDPTIHPGLSGLSSTRTHPRPARQQRRPTIKEILAMPQALVPDTTPLRTIAKN